MTYSDFQQDAALLRELMERMTHGLAQASHGEEAVFLGDQSETEKLDSLIQYLIRFRVELVKASPIPDLDLSSIEHGDLKLAGEHWLEEYKQQKALLEAIFEADPSGIAVMVGPELRFTLVNPAYRYLCPDPQIDPIGRAFDEVFQESGIYDYRERLHHVLETGQPFQTTGVEHYFPDGTRRIFTFQARRMEWEDRRAVLLIMWDATEGKRAEQALRDALQAASRSEERFRSVLENSLDVAYRRNLRTDSYDYVSPVVEQVLGYTPAEMRAMKFPELIDRIHPEDQTILLSELEKATRIGRGRLVYRFCNNRGEYRWLADNITTTKDAQGNPIYRIGILRDITDLKQSTDLLVRSERILAQAEQMAHLGAWEIPVSNREDLSANPLFWSDEVFRIFGYQVGEVEVTNNLFYSHVPQEDRHRIKEAIQQAIADRKPYNIEHRIRLRNGDEKIVREHAEMVFDELGRLERVIGAVQDITDQKKAEEALHQSEQRFRVALANAPITVFKMDAALRYTWIYHPNLGLTEASVLGKRDDELGSLDDVTELMALKQQVLDSGQGLQREYIGDHHGEKVHLLITLEPIHNNDNQVIGLTGSAMDITSIRLLETSKIEYQTKVEVQRRLLEQREQERLNIARDLHDGPMQEILGAVYTLQEIIPNEADENLADQIKGVAETLQRQIDEMRSYASDLRPPTLGRFGLIKAIQSYLEKWAAKHPSFKVEFRYDQEDQVIPELLRLPLFRICQEALNNIANHSHATQVTIRLEKDVEGEIRFAIQDNGRGFTVPKDWLDLARRGHLGLVGMRERAEAIGGIFTVTSAHGKGTGICVTVPMGDKIVSL